MYTIVFMKVISYAITNKWCRYALRDSKKVKKREGDKRERRKKKSSKSSLEKNVNAKEKIAKGTVIPLSPFPCEFLKSSPTSATGS